MKANIPEVEALVNTDRSLVCDGKKGLLTRILTVMKREPPDSSFRCASCRAKIVTQEIKMLTFKESNSLSSPFFKRISQYVFLVLLFIPLLKLSVSLCRFWQARAVESFLRGATSYADQMFLLKRGLLEVKLQLQIGFLIIHENTLHHTDLMLILIYLE